jgi:hypothetical protein
LPKQPIPNISRAEYRSACLHRSPRFQKALLQFHQAFPPVFRSLPQGRKFSTLPTRLRQRLTFKSSDIYLGSLASLEDLKILQSMNADIEIMRNRWERLLPYQGAPYFKAIGKEARTYQRKLNRLKKQWPHVSGEVFTSGNLTSGNAFPALLIPPLEEVPGGSPQQLRINQREWNRSLIQAGKKAVLMIPIWPHTVETDVNWAQIRRWKTDLSSTAIPRTHDTVLGTRLAVYDRYQELRSFSAVGKELKIPQKKARDHYLRALYDINGETPKGTTKARRIQGFDVLNHTANCTRCSRADQIEKMCPVAIAYANEEESSAPSRTGQYKDGHAPNSLAGGGKRKTPRPHHDQLDDE